MTVISRSPLEASSHVAESRIACAAWAHIPGMVLAISPDGCSHYVSGDYSDFTGVPLDSTCGLAWNAALLPQSHDELLAAVSKRVDFSLTISVRLANGRRGWLLCVGYWCEDDAVCLCLLHDVSALMHATRTREEQLRLVADSVPAALAYFAVDTGRCVFANRRFAKALGRTEDEVVGRCYDEMVSTEAARRVASYVQLVVTQRRAVSFERERPRGRRPRRWRKVELLPHLDEHGLVQAVLVLLSDVGVGRYSEPPRGESPERLARFMHASAEGVIFHRNEVIDDANPAFCRLLGYSSDELAGRSMVDLVAPEERSRLLAIMRSPQDSLHESVAVHRDGLRIPVEVIVRTMERNGEQLRIAIVRDLRGRQAVQARIQHLAHHDELTGLLKRSSFVDCLELQMGLARRSGESLALLFIDLDDFKRVNDSLGHLVGDTLLQMVALRIVDTLRNTDQVARFGGDEFMVLLPHVPNRSDAEDVARRLIKAIGIPFEADGQAVAVTPSIGISVFPGDADSPDDLIRNADTAMYVAKSHGKANFQFFDPSITQSAFTALLIESQLAQAIQRQEFVLYFQPRIGAGAGELTSVEALVYWQHPEHGLLHADAFMSLADRQRLVLPIGKWMLREAMRNASRWARQGGPRVPVAISVPSRYLHSEGFVDEVEQLLDEQGVDASMLELGFAAGDVLDDSIGAGTKLARLKALGVGLAIQEFGATSFSMRQLYGLPVDKLGIYQDAVSELGSARDTSAIVRATISMAHGLGLRVIATGIETTAQRSFLAGQCCDELQGALLAAPLAAPLATDAFEDWLRRGGH